MDANLVSLAAQREPAWGTLPAPVTLALVRMTKENLDHSKVTVKSAELRPDRRQGETALVGVNAQGGFEFELTVGDHDQFLESSLCGAFVEVDDVPTLVDGITRTSYLLEKRFPGIPLTPYVSFSGMMVNTMTLNFASRQIITGAVEFMGIQGALAANTLDAAAGYTAAGTGGVLTSSANVAALKGTGGATLAGVKSLTLTINNNLRGNDVIGKLPIDEVGMGSIMVSGRVEAYFRNNTLLQEFIDHAPAALSLECSKVPPGAVAGAHIGYRVTVPKLRWTRGFPQATGKDTDVMLPLEFEAEVGEFNGAAATIAIEKLLQP